MKNRHPKHGYLGPAFHSYLEYLEEVEHIAITGKAKKKGGRALTINKTLWDMPEDDEKFTELMRCMIQVDAVLAPIVRSSVKYKIEVDTLLEIADRYTDELMHIDYTYPMRLPHQWCSVIIEGFGSDDMIIVAQEQVVEDHKCYHELGLCPDEIFICLNIGAYRKYGVELENGTIAKSQTLSHFPVEIHLQHNRMQSDTKVIYAGAGQVDPTKKGIKTLDLLYRSFVIWHHQFQLHSLLRHKQFAGVKAQPMLFNRQRLRKKTEHPQFEHTIIQLEVDAPDPSQTGVSKFQPKKRLHQVRGFWRQMRKSGKRVWVKPHWRGDDNLGVVRRDFELVTHEGEEECLDLKSERPSVWRNMLSLLKREFLT